MRSIEYVNGRILLNGSVFYQRLILDQGYWPESILTPPSDEAIKKDILLTKKMGFNGARKHQKIENPRYYYWADRLGLVVWGSFRALISSMTTRWRHRRGNWCVLWSAITITPVL